MTIAVQQLLTSFDALSEAEKQKAAAEVLRRVLRSVPGQFPEESFVAAAEELSLELDAREDALAAACRAAGRDNALEKEIDEWQSFEDNPSG
jgi:hypothetical protein